MTYTNGSDKPQLCSGLALPYSEVKAEGLDQKGADEDREKTLKAFDTILGKGVQLFWCGCSWKANLG